LPNGVGAIRWCAVVVTMTAVLDPGATDVGFAEHVVPVAIREQVKLTAALNPFFPVTPIVYVAAFPATTVTLGG